MLTFGMTNSSPADLISQGRQARNEKRLAEAKNYFSKAFDISRQAGDEAMLAVTLCGLGQIERDLGNLSVAMEHYSEAVGLRRSGGDTPALAHTIRHLADILREQGSQTKAAPYYEKAIQIYRSYPETAPLDLANSLRGYALLKDDSGCAEQALHLWREAAALYEQAGVKAGIAECRSHIAFLLGQ
jgi:tetratricopeptide (TPR) repeat protein